MHYINKKTSIDYERQNLVEVNMSADIPLDLVAEIIKRFPVRSLLRFRSVSKRWRALIDSSEFITHYTANHTQPHHLLVIHDERRSLAQYSYHSVIVGCSHGLVCFYTRDPYPSKVVIWNPSIRKSVCIKDYCYETKALGFGVCPKTLDIKLVRIMRRSAGHYEAEVYTLRLDAWRSVSMNLTRKPRKFPNDAVVIDGVIHWLVFEYVTKYGKLLRDSWIISFDLESEEFSEVCLPDSLAGSQIMGISKRKESLVILDYRDYSGVCEVWMMFENGVSSSSFIGLITVQAYPHNIIGFRKNGQLFLTHCRSFMGPPELQVYDPDSNHMTCLGTLYAPIKLFSYTESLLLLNHSTSTIIQ